MEFLCGSPPSATPYYTTLYQRIQTAIGLAVTNTLALAVVGNQDLVGLKGPVLAQDTFATVKVA